MKRFFALFFFLLLLFCFSAAHARTVPCPAADITLSLPDGFSEIPLSGADDPTLFLHWQSRRMTILGYVSYMGDIATPDLFQVLTGSETDSGLVSRAGVQMLYAKGSDYFGAYVMYTWMNSGKNITLYFYYPENDPSCLDTAEEVMNSLRYGVN